MTYGFSRSRGFGDYVQHVAMLFMVGLAVAVVVTPLSLLPPARRIEERLGDKRMVLWRQLSEANTTPIVIVPIDEESLQEVNLKWPLPRGEYARMVTLLRQAGAAVIVFTDFFGSPGGDVLQDNALANAVRQRNDVVLASRLDLRSSTPHLVKPYFDCSNGFTDVPLAADGVIRRFFVARADIPDPPWCLALEVSRHFFQDRDLWPQNFGGAPGSLYPINYAGAPGTAFATVALRRVLFGGELTRDCKGKIVLIGSALESADNLLRTPFAKSRRSSPQPPMSNLELMANLVFTMINSRDAIETLHLGEYVILVGAVIFLSFQLCVRLNFLLGFFLMATLMVLYGLGVGYAMIFHHRCLPILGPVVGIVASFGAAVLFRLWLQIAQVR